MKALACEEEEHGLEVRVSGLRCAEEVFYEFYSLAIMLERPVKAGVLADVDGSLPLVVEVFMEVWGLYSDVFVVEVLWRRRWRIAVGLHICLPCTWWCVRD